MCRDGLEDILNPFEAETARMTIAVAFTVDYSARYEEQRSLFGHAYRRGLAGCVGEESEGESRGRQFSDSRSVAEKAGGVSGIGVAQRSKLLVVTGISYNAGVVKYFFSTLLHPLRDERHFALVEISAIPTKARS